MGERKFWRRGSEGGRGGGGSNYGEYHEIAPLGECQYNFLMPVFWLQFSRILLSGGSVGLKNFFQFIVWYISVRVKI